MAYLYLKQSCFSISSCHYVSSDDVRNTWIISIDHNDKQI